jgi:hypothetical protein
MLKGGRIAVTTTTTTTTTTTISQKFPFSEKNEFS